MKPELGIREFLRDQRKAPHHFVRLGLRSQSIVRLAWGEAGIESVRPGAVKGTGRREWLYMASTAVHNATLRMARVMTVRKFHATKKGIGDAFAGSTHGLRRWLCINWRG